MTDNLEYSNLFNYCTQTLLDQKRREETELFNKLMKNIKNKIKNALIDKKTHIILYDDTFNNNVKNIVRKLKKKLYPFNVIYRKKTISERSFLDIIFENNVFILIIDWSNYFSYHMNSKLHNMIHKYIDCKKKTFELDVNFYNIKNIENYNDNIQSDNTDHSNATYESFDLIN